LIIDDALLKRLDFLVEVGRFMLYENEKKNDQIASSTGQSGLANCKESSASLLPSVFTETFHPASTVCHPGPAAILEDRLSRHRTDAEGFLRLTKSPATKRHTALFNTLLRGETLGKKRAFENLLKAIFKWAKALKLLDKLPQGALDATGLETRYTSQHYIRCARRKSFYRRRWPKITIVCDTKTHLIAGCIVTRGPSLDFPNLPKLMKEADKQVKFDQLLADAGYDSEDNHCFCREFLGIRSTIIAYNPRRSQKLPTARYRREMATHFDKKAYNNRWQVESVFSRHKRLLGSALRNRSEVSRERECLLRILTHNLMIIRRVA